MLLREDCLKAAIYHHLRRALSTRFLVDENVRVLTEYALSNNQRADIAVVQLKPSRSSAASYDLGSRTKSVLAIIECKYKSSSANLRPFKEDAEKVRDLSYLTDYPKTQFYLASIWEAPVESEHRLSVLSKKQQESWGRRAAELVGYRLSEDDPMRFTVLSHNRMNRDLG